MASIVNANTCKDATASIGAFDDTECTTPMTGDAAQAMKDAVPQTKEEWDNLEKECFNYGSYAVSVKCTTTGVDIKFHFSDKCGEGLGFERFFPWNKCT